ncbi:MAG: chaperone modulator CbpM [Bacteroidota bacterium]|nr:chaperone modulator CbpM [Bacteroidota bacterium]
MPEHLIPADEFCTHYKVEYSFINSLQQHGLIEITTIDETSFIDEEHLHNLEKLIRLHYDLDINLEGIEAITYLLNRVKNMQNEIVELRNKLSLYENDNF